MEEISDQHEAVETGDQLAPLYFLDRNVQWDTVKPYNFHYFPKEDFPMHNILRSPRKVHIRNLRSLIPDLSLDKQGFEVCRLGTRMSISDFKDEALVENIYIRELEAYFMKTLGARQVRALDFQLRVRDRNFPYYGEKPELKPQPSLMTHVGTKILSSFTDADLRCLAYIVQDVTPDATKSIVRELYGTTAEKIMESRYQIITVWRPLRVPVRDWPLALCDASTVDMADLVASDVIYPNYLAENRLVHYNDNQRWYWLSDQAENEVLVFKAVDSDPKKCNVCPHGAFPITDQDETLAIMRESIDVRLLVMYADVDYPEPEPWSSSAIKI